MKKSWFVFLMGILMAVTSFCAAESELNSEWSYEILADGSAMITGYSGTDAEVIIPETLDGHTVTALAYNAFWFNEDITSVEIPASLTAIGDYVYLTEQEKWVTGIKTLHDPYFMTPEAAKIMVDLFASEAEEDQVNPFMGCLNLEKISVAPENTVFVLMGDMLVNKNNLESLTFPAGLERSAYEIPEGIRSIGFQTFYGCRMESVSLPESLHEINHNPFVFCLNLKTISAAVGNESFSVQDSALVSKDGTLIVYPYASDAASYTVPAGVTAIGSGAFFGSPVLESVIVSDGVQKIGGRSFDYCESLRSVSLPEGLLSIGDSAFKNCELLTEINLPGSITYIDENTFTNVGKQLVLTAERNSYGALWAKVNAYRFHFPGEEEEKSRLTQVLDGLKDEEGHLSKFHLHYRADYESTGRWIMRDVYVINGSIYMIEEDDETGTAYTLYKDGVVYTLFPESKTGKSVNDDHWSFESDGVINESKNLFHLIRNYANRTDYIESSRYINGTGCLVELFPEYRYGPEIGFYFDSDDRLVYCYEEKYYGLSPAGMGKGELLFTIYELTNDFDESDLSVFDISDYEISGQSE